MEETYRWTLDEYVMRCEDGVGLTEILTEGNLDRDVFAEAAKRWQIVAISVIDADYLAVTVEDMDDAGLPYGVRSQLLTVAQRLEEREAEGTIHAKIAVVVDRDYEPIRITSRFLFVTDGYSIENYLICEDVFDRFVMTGLGRAPRPDGRDGGAATTVQCSGRSLLARVVAPAIELAGVRLALRDLSPPVAVFEKWPRYLTTDSDGKMILRGAALVAQVLQRERLGDETADTEKRREAAVVRVAASPITLIRGRDFVAILLQLLKSKWGRKLAGNPQSWSDERLKRVLFLAVSPVRLDESGLFSSVKAHIA